MNFRKLTKIGKELLQSLRSKEMKLNCITEIKTLGNNVYFQLWFCVLRTQTLTRQSHFFLLSSFPKFPQLKDKQDRWVTFKTKK